MICIVNVLFFIKGVLNLWGVIVFVVDLCLCFDFKLMFDVMMVMVIFNVKGCVVGVVVDVVLDVIEFGFE